MRTKLLCCLFFGAGVLASCSLGVIARQQASSYPDNVIEWWSEVSEPPGNSVGRAAIQLIGTGGIKVNTELVGGSRFIQGKYKLSIDGSGISSPAMNAVKIDHDFDAAISNVYFVSTTATCTLPSAAGVAGKEILVWNAASGGGTVTYASVSGQLISGNATGTLSNSTPYKLDRFMSNGSNWFKE